MDLGVANESCSGRALVRAAARDRRAVHSPAPDRGAAGRRGGSARSRSSLSSSPPRRTTSSPAIANDAPRGLYPRAFLGEHDLVDARRFRRRATTEPGCSSDGALRAGTAVVLDRAVRVARRAGSSPGPTSTPTQVLLDGDLPIPTVRWTHPSFTLEVTAFAFDTLNRAIASLPPDEHGARADRAQALPCGSRPFQVNPPSQFLNTPGGVGRAARIAREGNAVAVDGLGSSPLTAPWSFGATVFDAGDITSFLAKGELPHLEAVDDPGGRASAAHHLRRRTWHQAPRAKCGSQPRPEPTPLLPASSDGRDAGPPRSSTWWPPPGASSSIASRSRCRATQRTSSAQRGPTSRTSSSNRDGPALQPGTRSYARSWIRDGAMMAAALLRLGHAEAVRDFLAVVRAVPVPDRQGAVLRRSARRRSRRRERQQRRAPLPRRRVPPLHGRPRHRCDACGRSVAAAVALSRRSCASSAAPRRTATPDKLAVLRAPARVDQPRGLLGQADALLLGRLLGAQRLRRRGVARRRARPPPRRRHAGSAARDEFKQDLLTSIARGARGQAASTTSPAARSSATSMRPRPRRALPAGADADLPRGRARARRSSATGARLRGTPRRASAMGGLHAVRVAQRRGVRAPRMARPCGEARELAHGRPHADRAGTSGRRSSIATRPRRAFLGDLPHGWVGSDFIRSFLDMFAYERGRDGALVLAAGVPHEWLAGSGLTVRALRTPHGALSYTVREEGGAFHVSARARPRRATRRDRGGRADGGPDRHRHRRRKADEATGRRRGRGPAASGRGRDPPPEHSTERRPGARGRGKPMTEKVIVLLVAAVLASGWAGIGNAGGADVSAGFLFKTLAHEGRELRYAVYVPRAYDPSRPWPLILFLHGSGESGTDGSRQLAQGLPRELVWNPDRWPFIVVIPQKPSQDTEWEQYELEVMTMLAHARREYNVDPTHLVLTGLSQGGHGPGCWAPATRSCGRRWCPSAGTVRRVSPRRGPPRARPPSLPRGFKGIPVWAFHGEADDVVPVRETRVDDRGARVCGGAPPRDDIPGRRPRLLGARLRRAGAARLVACPPPVFALSRAGAQLLEASRAAPLLRMTAA